MKIFSIVKAYATAHLSIAMIMIMLIVILKIYLKILEEHISNGENSLKKLFSFIKHYY